MIILCLSSLFLASEANHDSGTIFNCGAGWYNRSSIICAKGVSIGHGIRPIKPEEIQYNWVAIKWLEGAKPLDSVANSLNI